MTQKVRSFALKSIKEGITIRNLPEGNSSHRNLSGPLQLLSSLYKLELRGDNLALVRLVLSNKLEALVSSFPQTFCLI